MHKIKSAILVDPTFNNSVHLVSVYNKRLCFSAGARILRQIWNAGNILNVAECIWFNEDLYKDRFFLERINVHNLCFAN